MVNLILNFSKGFLSALLEYIILSSDCSSNFNYNILHNEHSNGINFQKKNQNAILKE